MAEGLVADIRVAIGYHSHPSRPNEFAPFTDGPVIDFCINWVRFTHPVPHDDGFYHFFVKNWRRRRRRNVHNSERNVCTRTGSWKQMTSRMKMRPLITTYQYSFYYSCIVLEFLWRGWRIPDSTRLTCERDDTPTSPNVVSLSSKTQQRRCAIVWGNMGNAHMVYLTREDRINQIYICIKYNVNRRW